MKPEPPTYRLTGVAVATLVVTCWALSILFLFGRPLEWVWIGFVPLQVFFWTGLFITAHDAMHGLVAPHHRRLNDAIGQLATLLYAAFPFQRLKRSHLKHHEAPGQGSDPDYHDGKRTSVVWWYFRFVKNYVSVAQIVALAIVFNVLEHVVGIPAWNLIWFWVVPSLLSTVQLFIFGTYLPHRAASFDGDRHHARSSSYPVWLSFITCYHFGYHREHHEWPYVPWWQLPTARWSDAMKAS